MRDRSTRKKRGRRVTAEEKALLERVSSAVQQASAGAESAIEDEAARQGASLLLEQQEDGFVSALAIMLIPRELKEGSRRIAAIAQPFGFVAKIGKERLAVIAPAGYVTDFASIPWYASWIINPFGRHAEAAVIHDWLYTLGKPGDAKNRLVADKAFVRALRLLEVGWLKRIVMYFFVRVGGKNGYGLAGDFTFRKLDDLSVLDPPPERAPYMNSFASAELPRSVRRKAAQAATAKEPAP